ncbi:MAG: hypothetical protein KCHDKBKB_01021 [Elusimicrobia bacterium]|nr:hypothetical protein [Elusimicrobiota bacterium]
MNRLVAISEDFIKSIFNDGKSLGPMLYIQLRETLVVLPYKHHDLQQEALLKQLAIAQIRAARTAGSFLFASSSSEAWVSMGKNLSPIHTVLRPSQDPDRKEAVLLQVWGPDGNAVFRGYELLRDGDKRKLGKLLMTNENNTFQVRTWLDPAFHP